jgi:hypothetical protein
MYKEEIQTVCEILHSSVERRAKALDLINMTLINVRISTGQLNHPEARALDVVADNIAKGVQLLLDMGAVADQGLKLIEKLNRGEEVDVKGYEEVFRNTGKEIIEEFKRKETNR